MISAFYLVAASMIILAVILIVHPLLRANPRQAKTKSTWAVVLTISVSLPATAIYLYTSLRTPRAIDRKFLSSASAEPAISNAPDVRTQQMQRDVLKWMEIAHAYDGQQRAAEALDAYGQALKIDADNTAAMVGWVEAGMSQHTDYSIDAPAQRMLERAIALEPDNQRALWLLGISEFQHKDYAKASSTWRHLQQLLDPNSGLAQSVAQRIAMANAKASMSAAAASH